MLLFLPKYAEEELDGYLSQAPSPVYLGIVIRLPWPPLIRKWGLSEN
jgi:hypothetical protein